MAFMMLDTQPGIVGGPGNPVSPVGVIPPVPFPLPPFQELAGWYSELKYGAAVPVFDWVTLINYPPVNPTDAVPKRYVDESVQSIVLGSSPIFSVITYLPPGQPDGVTDNTAGIQAAISAAAGVAPLIIPANVHPYIITGLNIPSFTHLTIEVGATLKLQPGISGNTAMLFMHNPDNSNVTQVLIQLYGTLDGNVVNQPLGANVHAGIGNQGTCSNSLIDGGKSGLIINTKSWPFNVVTATNVEVRGLTMVNGGNSVEFAGISTAIPIVPASCTYNNATGATMLVTTIPHGVAPGQTFTLTTPSGVYETWTGEFVAGAGTGGTTVNFTSSIGLGAIVFATANVGTCTKCYNVGFVDCIVDGIQDLGLVLYGGIVGGYVRGCEVRYCEGPAIFSDPAQPGTNLDCEISDCYCHHNSGAGPFVTSNAFNIINRKTRIYNNISAYNQGGGISVGAVDNCEVFDNLLHDNVPQLFFLPSTTTSACANLNTEGTNISVWNNKILDPQASILNATGSSIASGSYNSSTGAVSLVTHAAHGIPVGGSFFVQVIRGTGALSALRGVQVATAGTSGTTVNYSVAPGLGAMTFFDGALLYGVPSPPNNGIISGTYNSLTGAVSLVTSVPHGMVPTNAFVLSNVFSGGNLIREAGGFQIATAGTAGTTLNFTMNGGLSTISAGFTAGQIYPPNFAIWVNPTAFTGGDSLNMRVVDNFINDTQPSTQLVAAIAGTWGRNGYSNGNTYGFRWSVVGDISNYKQGWGGSQQGWSGNVQGPSQDTMFNSTTGSYFVNGAVTFSNGPPVAILPQGMTPAWNHQVGRGDCDFLCGQGGGGPGGFDFLQVSPLNAASGTYTSGTGAVTLTTNVLHGLSPGSPFTMVNMSNSSVGVNSLNGRFTATAGTSGTVLTYTAPTGLTLLGPITGGNVQPSGMPTTIGVVSGSYNSGTGAVSLVTASAHGIVAGGTFAANFLSDGDAAITSLNIAATATAGTTSKTLNYTAGTGLAITHPITGGSIIPAGTAGGVINTGVGVAGSLLANDGFGTTRLGGALAHGALLAAPLAAGGTITVPLGTSFVRVQNAATIATGTILLPAQVLGSFDQNELEINFQNPVTTLTIGPGAGAAVVNPPTTVTVAGTSFNFIAFGSTWVRRIMA